MVKNKTIDASNEIDFFWADGPKGDVSLPLVTVGVRFHDLTHIQLLERCLYGIGAQSGVRVHVHLVLQGFDLIAMEQTRAVAETALDGSGFSIEIDNVPNPEQRDMRAHLLNRIVAHHYDKGQIDYLCFIDFDDIWFQHALETLVEPLLLAPYALSYADIHCADLYLDSGQFYLREIQDVYRISQKTKRALLKENFLPLHSYMFHTGRVARSVLTYDDKLNRLEDFDVLLSVAHNHPISGLHRSRLIGLYNFYETASGGLNTTQSVFERNREIKPTDSWKRANQIILSRHGGKPWQDFWGEEWEL